MSKIPGGVTPEHFMKIREFLSRILRDVQDTGAKPMWVSCRLNETREDISPVFVGFFEHQEMKEQRIRRNLPDPGLYRFGDIHYSRLYEECLQRPGEVVQRDWRVDQLDPHKMEDGDAKFFSQKLGVMYRRSLGIKVDHLCVGTINVGFKHSPETTDAEIEAVMRRWAIEHDSDLTNYLQQHFELGGPNV
jgi:hypothetical protein